MKSKGLEVELAGDNLVISIGIKTLAHAIKCSPELEGYGKIKILDCRLFAMKMSEAMQREDEIGTTPIHSLFDEAARHLIEYGEEGIELEETHPTTPKEPQ